jgi:hypothetical protein
MNDYTDPLIESAVENIANEIATVTAVVISDFERGLLRDAFIFAKTSTPNNFAHVVDDMEKLTRLEDGLNYLIYQLIQYKETLSFDYYSQYNPLFASLTRAGRPNQAAVDAEVLSKNSNALLVVRRQLNRIEQLIDFLKAETFILRSKTKTFDAKRSNTF